MFLYKEENDDNSSRENSNYSEDENLDKQIVCQPEIKSEPPLNCQISQVETIAELRRKSIEDLLRIKQNNDEIENDCNSRGNISEQL